MRYGISTTVLSSPGIIEIDEDEYTLIKNAIESLSEALHLEETFELVTENFCEYETELLSITSRSMIFFDVNYFSMNQDRSLITRRIVNLLSTCRMYLDQSPQYIDNIYKPDKEKFSIIEKEKNNQFDQKLGYRAMEALRNYVQHRGFPTHNIIFSHERVDGNPDSPLRTRIIPKLILRELEKDGKFKKSVFNELKSIQKEGYIDLRPLIREYVEGIACVHEKARGLIKTDLMNWETILYKAIDKFQDKFGKDTSLAGLALIFEKEDELWEDDKQIFKEFIERLHTFERKNRFLVNLQERYASNEILKEDSI